MGVTLTAFISYFLSGISLGLSAVASPGPFQAYLTTQTLRNGWRRTISASLAPLISDGPVIVIVLLVLTQIPDTFLAAIQLAGGIILIYFSIRTFYTFKNYSFEHMFEEESSSQSLFEAAMVNLLGPGAWVFWSLILGPILLEAWRISPVYGVGFLIGFYGMMILGLAGFVVVLGASRYLGARFNRILLGLSAIVLLIFGLYQFINGLLSI